MSRISSALAHACILLRGPDADDKMRHAMASGPNMSITAWKPRSLSSRAALVSCSRLRSLKIASASPTRTTCPKYDTRQSGSSGSACSSQASYSTVVYHGSFTSSSSATTAGVAVAPLAAAIIFSK